MSLAMMITNEGMRTFWILPTLIFLMMFLTFARSMANQAMARRQRLEKVRRRPRPLSVRMPSGGLR